MIEIVMSEDIALFMASLLFMAAVGIIITFGLLFVWVHRASRQLEERDIDVVKIRDGIERIEESVQRIDRTFYDG